MRTALFPEATDLERGAVRLNGCPVVSTIVAGVCSAYLAACTGQIGGLGGSLGTGAAPGWTSGTGAGGQGTSDPGRVTLHRLNRVEYNNTVRDLLGTSLTPANEFPVDDRGRGFDNMADVLSLSPLQLNMYRSAAIALVDETMTNAALRARLVACDLVSEGETCARAVLARFVPRAWRRPVTDAELAHLMKLIGTARTYGDSYEQGLKLALEAVLVSPHFLFRVELDPTPTSTAPHPLDPYELASRLSYFLWSTMPDDELFAQAKSGALHDPATLSAQAQRMLKSPKAQALVDNFAGQWLYIRMMDEVAPDPEAFPKFDAGLRAAMKSEAERLFQDVVAGAISADQLLTANFTYVNDRLAAHYGLPSPGSSNMVRVNLPAGAQRGGFLSQGSFLTVTSHTTRTSPVVRGKWVLGQLLCTDVPPPPPDVDVTSIDQMTGGTLRQRLEAHRANPKCAACHGLMDPIGFGLENYDAVGAYRTADGQAPIDASGTLPSGQAFTGALQLERLIANDSNYAACLVDNLYAYALGREPDTTTPGHLDRSIIEALADRLRQSGYDFRDLAARIVTSATFTSRRGEAGSP